MRAWGWLVGVCAFAAAGCSHPKVASQPAPDLRPRLDAADALLRIGCFDCLTAALAEYDALRTFAAAPPAIADAATIGAVRAGLLLDLRERELGTTDDGYLARAREVIDGRPDLPAAPALALDLVDAVSWTGSEARDLSDEVRRTRARLFQNRLAWKDGFLAKAADNELSAYLWLSFACGSGEAFLISADDLASPLAATKDTPVIAFKRAICPRMDLKALDALMQAEPRFVEINYYRGVQAILRGQLDAADEALERAYHWRPKWPAVTQTLASVAITSEEFDRALRFYDETLALVPEQRDAMLGRAVSLSYLGRHDEAIQAADHVLEARWNRGEAYYWRAWNDMQLNHNDQAWTDVEEAGKLLIRADVLKLAGQIAYRRQQLDLSRMKFEEGYRLKSGDCEIPYYLGIVDAELRMWAPSAEVFIDATSCLADGQKRLANEIVRIEASRAAPERKARLIGRREQQIRNAGRMIATSSFNTAVAYFNLSRKSEARQYAEKVSSDEQFGERARELLSRLEK